MIVRLVDAEVNRKVVYTAYKGAAVEEGVITGKNDTYVFVRYGNDVHSKATPPENLEYV